MRSELRLLGLAIAVSLAAPSCGASGESFSPTFREYREPGFSSVLDGIRRARPRDDKPVVVGVTARPWKLFAFDLAAGRKLWEIALSVEPRSAPIAAGELVVTQEGDEIVARSLASGEELFTVDADDDDARLVGADGAGSLAAITLAIGPANNQKGRLVVARGDDVAWERDLALGIGVPAVLGDLVFVPWATQRVSVLDAESGQELARLRIRDDVIGHAFVDRGAVYLGQHGVFRLTRSIETGSKTTAAYFAPAPRHLPGQPLFLRDGYEPAPPPDSARHRLRLVWKPAGEGETVRLEDDRLYLVFYRFVFAFDPASDTLHWVYEHPADIVGAAVQPGGLMVADDSGKVAFISAAKGQRVWDVALGARPIAASLRPGSMVPSGTPQGEPPPLRDQLVAAARMSDARLAGGRALAIRYLARFEEPEITQKLIELCADRGAPDPVRNAACDQLAERSNGDADVLAALERHGSFLRGTQVPPVGALARAAAHMQLRRAVPLLLSHLSDPRTRVEDLAPLIASLEALGERSAAGPIEAFLRLYHAEPESAPMAAALKASVDALATMRARQAQPVLERVADDPSTIASVREYASHKIPTLGVPQQPAAQPQQPAAQPQQPQRPAPGQVSPPAPEQPADARPERLTGEIVDSALAPMKARLEQCLGSAEGAPNSARIVIVVDGRGGVQNVVVGPASLQTCMEPLVREARFPATRVGREQITHFVRRGAPEATPAAPPHGRGRRDGGAPPSARRRSRDAGAP